MQSHVPLQTFTELFALGFSPMPVIWDLKTKTVLKHPEHVTDITDGRLTAHDVERWLNNGFKNFNGVALKVYAPFGMIDFDLKNTTNKNLYKEWFAIISNTNPDILSKICIETTKSNGFHVYIKYSKLDHKIPIARNPTGSETISIYTGGLLSYCYPSPGYELIHNDFADVQELTADEFQLLVNTGAIFNECEDFKIGENKVAIIDYPVEYENVCLQFDQYLSNEGFETLLNSIDLYATNNQLFKKKQWRAFLRKGSTASYSAKAYFNTNKRLLIFSASMVDFPTWHDSAKSGDNTWSLSPSKIVFYKNKRDWGATISEIEMICESVGIEIAKPMPVTEQNIISPDRLKFPYDIFPDRIQNFIRIQSIQHEYLGGAILCALSVAVGNTVSLIAKDGYHIKPVLYLAIIAPPGASKSPALTTAFSCIEEYDNNLYEKHLLSIQDYNQKLASYEKDKKNTEKPNKPNFPQTIIKDSTIEMVIKILSHNKLGCGVLADELSGFLKRMNQYKSGDEIQKWLELWSSSPVLLQRISRDENKVNDPFCSVVGGIQPGVLESLSKDENEYNGFFHRFLFVYPVPEFKPSWESFTNPPLIVKTDFATVFTEILYLRNDNKTIYFLTSEANELYGKWYNHKNDKYNKSDNDHVKGIIAKYQNYCLRFALLIQVIEDGLKRSGQVSVINMEKAIRLTEYFLGNMHKAIKLLVPETPVDKLQPQHLKVYNDLPEAFTTKTAISVAESHGVSSGAIKMFLKRNINKLFNQTAIGEYSKIY